MQLKDVYDTEKQYVIIFTTTELEVILKSIRHNIERENREISVTEDDLMKGINEFLTKYEYKGD